MFDIRDTTASDAQQLGIALGGSRSVNAPMPFAAGLSVNETYGAFAWRDLPGLHTRGVFQATSWFRALSGTSLASFAGAVYGSAMAGDCCFSVGSTGYRNGSVVVLGAACTGVHQGLLGSIFTTGTSLFIASNTEVTKTFTPAGLTGITKPCEINGFVFFTACVGGAEVIAYLPPPFAFNDATLGGTEALQRRVQYFATEHLGTSARVGLWQGRIVAVTTKGIWGIKPLSDAQGYGLDTQIASWNLSPEAQFGITHDDIWALDQSVLLRHGQSEEIIHSCGFTVLSSDGRIAVLSEPGGRFAVSNGSDFEEFGGDQSALVVGTLLSFGTSILSTERVAWTGVSSVWLTTAWARFPNMIAIEEIFLDPAVLRVRVLTETGSFDLMRSSVAPALWRAGCAGTQLKVMIEVPVGVGITTPMFKLKRRTAA